MKNRHEAPERKDDEGIADGPRPMKIAVPRDREDVFEPANSSQISKRISGIRRQNPVDCALGLTTDDPADTSKHALLFPFSDRFF
jgi:hypothetical protein